MAQLNFIACADVFGNTGIGKCSMIPKNVVSVFLVPNNFVITPANAANLQTFLQGKAQAANKSERIFPIHNINTFTDSSEDPVSETTGYGDVVPLRDGNYNWNFRYIKGGICLLKSLRKFNGQNLSVLFVDADGVIFGRSLNGNLAGVPLISFFQRKWSGSDSTTVANMSFDLSFKPQYINEQFGFVKDESFDPSSIYGIQDLIITQSGVSTDTVLNVSVSTACGGENVFDLFGEELADGTLWVVLNALTGAPLTITSVAQNAATKSFVITLDAARTTAVIVSLVATDVLATNDIEGFESNSLEIPLP